MAEPNKGSYKNRYKELKVIGSGNFGSATLISPRENPERYFVAKKVLLGKIDDKEKQSAQQEAELLKKLNHPHIVQYIDSFIEDGFFIIVMEYCEEGDLAYHIKKTREKGEHFSEELILNWFLQIVFALTFIHSKKILHRDIKASNIFLTSHGFVKLGDFGISKILEGTMEKADTVIGTPYYMSPEVCENTPYSYKSDVWALGCVLYELCTLKHAFSASNLLGLVYKIIQEKQDPIPDMYSSDLKSLVAKLLTKKHEARPNIEQISKYEFVNGIAKKFLEKNGDVGSNFIPVIKRTEVHLEKELTGYGQDVTGLTPKEKLQLKKKMNADKERAQLNQAARETIATVHAAKKRKERDMQSSIGTFSYTKTGAAAGFKKQPAESTYMDKTGLRNSVAMDKSLEFYGEGTLESQFQQTGTMGGTKKKNNKAQEAYNDYPTQTIDSMQINSKLS